MDEIHSLVLRELKNMKTMLNRKRKRVNMANIERKRKHGLNQMKLSIE